MQANPSESKRRIPLIRNVGVSVLGLVLVLLCIDVIATEY